MYYTIKTLSKKGKNISKISRELGIDRKTVRKILSRVKDGEVKVPEFSRKSILEPYKEEIIEYISEGLSCVLIHRKLLQQHDDMSLSYSCVKKYVRKLKGPGKVYVPLISPPGEEAQVDFGYCGYLYDSKSRKKVKSWIFCMVLSFSRYKYFEIVQAQDVKTFLRCHINAFNFFKGVPKITKIDNLKSGVLKANFYEPEIQREYAEMLRYYGSSPLTCKVRYPEEKGKVESGIKYVKNNFFKFIKETDYYKAQDLLRNWQNEICNKRIHGTTRKIPLEQFLEKEQKSLLPLPSREYEVLDISERIVNSYGHIAYRYNFYSVPYCYTGKKVTIKSNDKVLKIYNESHEEIAVHSLSSATGEFITNEFHNPRLKHIDYEGRSLTMGPNVYEFYINLREKNLHYHRIITGVFDLAKKYGDAIVDLACKRANEFNSISYLSVRKICENGLYVDKDASSDESVRSSGYCNDLKQYDLIVQQNGGL